MTIPHKPWWRPRARFSLRGLLVCVTLFMLWGGYHTNRDREERAAAEFFQARGASIVYFPSRNCKSFVDRCSWCYTRVVQALWREPFIDHISVFGPMDDSEVDALTKLPHLQFISTQPEMSTPMENYAIQHEMFAPTQGVMPRGALRRILANRRLKSLCLAQWELSDEDCEAIRRHNTLFDVKIFGCKLSEEGFAQIVSVPKLRSLTFSFGRTTGSQLAGIPGSQSLESIECLGAPVGNEFADFIGRSPRVNYLRCYHKQIDDSFIAAIGPHPGMEWLNLGHTKATDASVPALQQMLSLKGVGLSSRTFTDVGKAQLQQSSPQLIID